MKNTVKFGEGQISGYISVFLGILSFLAVLCFKYPEWLTTPEFREVVYWRIDENVIDGSHNCFLPFCSIEFYIK